MAFNAAVISERRPTSQRDRALEELDALLKGPKDRDGALTHLKEVTNSFIEKAAKKAGCRAALAPPSPTPGYVAPPAAAPSPIPIFRREVVCDVRPIGETGAYRGKEAKSRKAGADRDRHRSRPQGRHHHVRHGAAQQREVGRWLHEAAAESQRRSGRNGWKPGELTFKVGAHVQP